MQPLEETLVTSQQTSIMHGYHLFLFFLWDHISIFSSISCLLYPISLFFFLSPLLRYIFAHGLQPAAALYRTRSSFLIGRACCTDRKKKDSQGRRCCCAAAPWPAGQRLLSPLLHRWAMSGRQMIADGQGWWRGQSHKASTSSLRFQVGDMADWSGGGR